MVDLIKETGTWRVVTKSSTYLFDCDSKLAKRVPSDSPDEGFRVSALRKDDLWFKFNLAVAIEGEPMKILASDINSAEDTYTFRITTPVSTVSKVL